MTYANSSPSRFSPYARAILPLVMLAACEVDSFEPLRQSGASAQPPDFMIVSVAPQVSGEITDLDTVLIQVVMRNNGGSTDVGTSVAMFVDGVIAQELPVRGLEALEEVSLEFTWHAVAGTHAFLLAVDTSAAGATYIEESDETNNTDSLTLFVRYGPRTVVSQDTLTFGALPSLLASDTLVQAILQVVSDSGFSLGSQTMMVRTVYAEHGLRSFQVPLTNLSSPAVGGTLLTVTERSFDQKHAIFPYLLHVIDTASVVLYDGTGGMQWRSGPGSVSDTLLPGPISCAEGAVWPCALAIGVEARSPFLSALFDEVRSGTLSTLLSELTLNGTDVLLVGLPSTSDQIVDNPPTLHIGAVGFKACGECIGSDLHQWWTYGWIATATDDRGPVYFLTSPTFFPDCYGGTHEFKVSDNAGQVVSVTLEIKLPPRVTLVWRNRCHTQGHSQGGGG